jgi:predicted PurR-regulated permease PerM
VQPSEPAAAAASGSPTTVTPESRPAIRLVPAAAVIIALWWGQVVLNPLVLSVLVSHALEPFVSRLESLHIARPLAVPLLLVALLGVTGLGIYALGNEAVLFIEQLPEAARTVRQALQPDPREPSGAVAKVQQAAQELEQAAKDAAGPMPKLRDLSLSRLGWLGRASSPSVAHTAASPMTPAEDIVATEKSVLVAAVDVAANAGYASGR